MVDTDDTRRTIHDGRGTTPGVWHKLPTGELKIELKVLEVRKPVKYEAREIPTTCRQRRAM